MEDGGAGSDGQAARTATGPRESASPEPTTNAAPPATSARGRKGRRLVAQSGCFACHTIGFASLPREDRAAIVAYLSSLR